MHMRMQTQMDMLTCRAVPLPTATLPNCRRDLYMSLLANVVMQQCVGGGTTHDTRPLTAVQSVLCTWYRARFHVLAYRGRGIKFTTMCAKRASGCEIATTRTGSAVRSTAFGTMCAIRLCGIDRGTM